MENESRYITVKDARIFARNFQGLPTKYKPHGGERTFCLALTPELAEVFQTAGCNVKISQPKEGFEDAGPAMYLPCTVRFDTVPPNVFHITNGVRKSLTEETIGCLDYANIARLDLTINPYHWEFNGNAGVKAYVKTMAVTQIVDPIEEMYMDLPDGASNAITEE